MQCAWITYMPEQVCCYLDILFRIVSRLASVCCTIVRPILPQVHIYPRLMTLNHWWLNHPHQQVLSPIPLVRYTTCFVC